MKIIRIILLVVFIALLSACSYHSNTYPAELKDSKILTEDFLDGSNTISIRNDEIDFPNWSFRIFGKRILPKLKKEQMLYVMELERLRKINIQQKKIAKLQAKDDAKRKRYEKKIAKINNFPTEVKAGKTNFMLWFYTHDYKKVGYEYVYSEKALFWGLIKWGKRK
jgi:hypothetical protein